VGTPLQVAVISRHALVRAGLTHLIQDDPCRARVVDVGDAAQGHPLDVVVYDVAGRDPAEDDDLRQLIASRIAVVALQSDSGPDDAERILAMGAADVVSMDLTAQALLHSLEQAAAGHRVTPAAVLERAREAARSATGLTAREVVVLELIAAGLSNHEVAAELFVSINTVKSHVRSAYRRIGADSRSQAVIWTLRQGLVRHTDPAATQPEPDPVGAG